MTIVGRISLRRGCLDDRRSVTAPLEQLTQTPAGVHLGPLDLIADGGARNYVLEIDGRRFHGFIVRRGDTVHGYVDRCPHMGVPLARELDQYMAPLAGLIACGWHGALFRVSDGRCVAGPCTGASLISWPVRVSDGIVITGFSSID